MPTKKTKSTSKTKSAAAKKTTTKKTVAKKAAPKKKTTNKKNPALVTEKLTSVMENDAATTKASTKSKKVTFPIWGLLAVLLLLVFAALMLYEFSPEFKKNADNLIGIQSIDNKGEGMGGNGQSQNNESEDIKYEFPITIVYNENDPDQRANLEMYLTNVEANLASTHVEATWLDKESPEGQELIEKTDAKFLPIFATDKSIESHPQYNEFAPALVEVNDVLTIRSEGIEYLQTPEPGDATIIGVSPENADIVITEYVSYTCGFCARMHPVLQDAVEQYPGQISWVVKNFDRGGPDSVLAQAAECAADQDGFEEMVDALYAAQNDIMTTLQDTDQETALNETIEQIATNAGLNPTTITQCVEAGTYSERVAQQSLEGREFGIMGTPSMFINDTFVPGAISAEQLDEIIQEQLAS